MKYMSLFSGVGGFELGISQSIPDAECVGFSEIDKYAIQVYKYHFPEAKNYGDARNINTGDIPDIQLLCGGFPCQTFSIAGKRLGFDDTRGTLFFEIARIAKDKRPAVLFLENVKGLLNHNGGKTFKAIISTLDELGYDAEWSVLNSKYFGVPQNRERVFIIGHLRGKPWRPIFPLADTDKEDTRRLGKEISYAIDANYGKGASPRTEGRRQLVEVLEKDAPDKYNLTDKQVDQLTNGAPGRQKAEINPEVALPLQSPGHSAGNYRGMTIIKEPELKEITSGHSQGSRVYDPEGVSCTIASQAGGLGAKTGLYAVGINRKEGITGEKDIAGALNASDFRGLNRNQTQTAVAVLTPDRPNKRQNGRRMKTEGEEMFTLTAQDKQGVMVQALTERRTEDAKRIRKENQAMGKDYTPFRAKELVPNPEGVVGAITATESNEQKIKVHSLQTRGADRPSLQKNPHAGGSGHIQKEDETYCLDTGNTQGIEMEQRIRRLTPVECERLQGFPDNWTKIGRDEAGNLWNTSDSQRYKMMGNAVTVNVIREIAKRLKEGM